MEMRVGKRIDTDANGVRMLSVLAACFLLGGFLGCVRGVFLREADLSAASLFLNDFFLLAKNGSLACTVFSSFWGRLGNCVLVAVLAFSVFGLVGLPVFFLSRGFFLSCAVCCLFQVFGSDGFLPALVLFVLPSIFYLPAMFLAGIGGSCFGQRIRLSDARFCAYIKRFLLAIALLFFYALFECIFLPRVLCLLEL